MLTLRFGTLQASIDPHGAELRSLRLGNEEFLWQDEAKVWPHSAPLLFPFVGRLRDGRYLHKGQPYAMGIHGFAAGMDFEPVQESAEAATLLLRATAETRTCFPFEFRLQVLFRLDADGLLVRYEVHNDSPETMAFGLGSHPAFALGTGELQDWFLEFDQQEAPEAYRLLGDLLAERPEPIAFTGPEQTRIGLHSQLFERDALIIKQIKSRRIRLVHRQAGTRLMVSTGGAPHLGLWAVAGARFVCIEPWFGVDEDAAAPLELLHKPALNHLAPGACFECFYRIDPLPSQP
ncbi:aldose 1-epimerase family protein [Paucibacter sp. JuS9]|uniref:aldose 1-epimerase family protein n=1 Tax=Paucibacter sp. JuS9 TaxID=3228748 RepID=UPI0037564960